MGGHHCAAVNCINSSKNCNLSFFRVPKDKQRCKKWIQNSRRQDLMGKSTEYCSKNILFCADHFETAMFMNPQTRNRLVWNAEPTIFVVPNPPPRVTPKREPAARSSAPEASPYLQKKHEQKVEKTQRYLEECKAAIRRKRADRGLHSKSETFLKIKRSVKTKNQAISRLQKRLQKSETRERTKMEILESVKDKLSSDMCTILETQLSNSLVKRNCYTDAFKQVALSICFKSTACYKLLSKKLNLPPKRTLTRWLAHLSFHEGFDATIFELLELF